MAVVHPLVFDPIFQPRIWGGDGLARYLGKALPPGQPIGESWELADLPNGQSVVRDGPARGRTLNDLVREWGTALLGRASTVDGRFPLLIKFLDAQQDLSVQVHPTAEVAARQPGAALKNEAWYILHAEPGAAIYRGLKPGVTRDDLLAAVGSGAVADLLCRLPVRTGDCHYLPSGTVHALGAGVLVAEVQTPSDTTYRLFDWNRVDAATGKPRDLHVDQALACINFDEPAPPRPPARSHVASFSTTVTRLAACEQFALEKVRMIEGAEHDIPYAEPVVWIVLDGRVEIDYKPAPAPFVARRGDVVLLPAGLQNGRVRVPESSVWLEATLPAPSDLAGYERPARPSNTSGPRDPGPVPLTIPPGLRRPDDASF